ncbi:TIGR01777 family oxidoreductase [Nocardioides mesophilus]|uniref:TIGR01777 family protein n=1 Tax=Nocardioides mesophilus TaxID=433659 RepID=A0A7G9RC84_9ACTN|nr:TIGR01777 family oxidoreductase [Nocardioides mesophilus]QNN53209.1 TIGR01777 family protein [Nocardioides mesophilus]
MKLVLAGASGYLGTAWRDHLAQQGHEVTRLVRGEPMSADESKWDPYAGHVDPAVIEQADAVAALSGASLVRLPFSESYKKVFTDSRVLTTRTLAKAIARSERKPAFLAQNGIAGYGDRGDLVLTEDSPTDAPSFMGQVTRAWQDATGAAESAGARVVVMRTGVVLGPGGGAFKPLSLMFRFGLGGPVGSGEQYFSTISLHDWVRAATFLAEHEECRGAYNLSGPVPATNAEFGRSLGHLLHRPSKLRAPAWPIRKALGDVSSELLGSARVVPLRLEEAGFVFEHRTQEQIITAALGR